VIMPAADTTPPSLSPPGLTRGSITEGGEQSPPRTWVNAPLDRLGAWFGGGTPSKDNPNYWNGGSIPWVSPKDMKVARIFDTEDHITEQAVHNSATCLVPDGAVLMVTRSGILRHTFPVAVARVEVTLNQDLKALVLFDGLDGEYVAAALRAFGDEVISRCSKHGTTVQSIEFSRLKDFQIPVAPLNEQERIVAKIDELFSELDAGVASLKRARALLKKYRQAVLKAAVTGELTRDWRERHKGEIRESGAELLQRILKARRAAWETAELKKLRAKGRRPADDRWKQKYQEPQPPDTTGLPALPDGWVWATLDALAAVVGGVTKDAKREARGGISVPYLRVANVQRGYLDLTKIKEIIVDTDTVASLRLMKDDILFNEGGDIDKLGRGWIWQDELPECIHQNHVFRARLHLPGFSAKFVSWYANAIGQEYFMREGKQTTNLASVSLSKLKVFPVPVAPCEEIAETEAELERQLTVLDAFESLAEQEMRRCSALRQSILKAAFAGRLVPQDPNDEPAGVLLARIRAERAAKPRPTRGRRRRKTIEAPQQLELPA
jgi:type I restriction enzyme S subunit